MAPEVFAAVLLASLLHASWNTIVKLGVDPYLRLSIVNLTISLLALPFALLWPPPPGEAWPWLLASIAAHSVYYLTLARGYAHGDLSQVYPLARGLAPPLVALFAIPVAGEAPSALGLVGVLLVAGGVASLAWTGRRPRRLPAVSSAVLCGVAIALYSVFDGLGVRASPEPASYIAWLFLLEPFAFSLFVFLSRGRFALPPRELALAAVGGVLSGIAYALVIWAMSRAPMAYVSALRETSVLIAAAIGIFWLREPFAASRLAAAALVFTGALLLRLAG